MNDLAAFPDLSGSFGNHMLVADQAFRFSLQRPLSKNTKILDERLPTASLIFMPGRY